MSGEGGNSSKTLCGTSLSNRNILFPGPFETTAFPSCFSLLYKDGSIA